MQINLQGKNIELTEAIKDYVLKKVTNLGKLLSGIEEKGGGVNVNFEVGKISNHHKSGMVFNANCSITLKGQEFYATTDANDLYTAVDEVKEILFHDIQKSKDRRRTLLRRGAASIKKMMKGLSKRNPFTSKY